MPRNLRPIEVFPITTRVLEVLAVADVTPGMRRITLGGPGLAAHTAPNGFPVAAFRSEGFDDEFKILLRHPDAAQVVGPTQADGRLNWPRSDPHLLPRTYTVRRWDPRRGEIDVDVVRHGVGPATSWAERVQPGERVQVAGPKMSLGHPQGVAWTLVAGDETALPAIGRWLREWPAGASGQVLIEIADPSHRQDLPVPPGVRITWLSRDGAAPGTTTLLFDAIRDADWPPGRAFAWVAGEALSLAPIRRWLRQERGLAKDQVEVTGYWRRQGVVVSGDDPSLPDLEASADDADRLHELGELAPAFALRVAVTLGLPAALGERARTAPELAAATGASTAGLTRLLRYLAAIGILEPAGAGAYRLTDFGRQLDDDDAAAEFDLAGPVAHRELGGMLALLAAVRTGTGDYPLWFGADYSQRELADPARLAARVEHEAERAVYVAGATAALLDLPTAARVAVLGPAAGSFAEAIASRQNAVDIAAVDIDDIVVGAVGADLGAPRDAILLTDALRSLPDAGAVAALRWAGRSLAAGGAVLVFAQPLDPDLAHDHVYEEDLIEFALHGGGLRTHAEYLELFAAAGLSEPTRTTIGWGFTLYAAAPVVGSGPRP